MEENKGLPLGLCCQSMMKYESVLVDLNEILEDADLTDVQIEKFRVLADVTGRCMATIANMVSEEMEEEMFLAEDIQMDDIATYPRYESDIMDEEIE